MMNKVIQAIIAPSMMCANMLRLEDDLRAFERLGVELLHIDVMDGDFVPNYTLGTDYVRILAQATRIPLDIHLMITEPERKLDWFSVKPGDFVSIHYEATRHAQRALARIRAMGARPMLALNPATPVDVLAYVIDDVDGVLIMTVNPGYAGQKLVPRTIDKVRDARAMLDRLGRGDARIEVDGNVSVENAKLLREAGADVFVAGTAGLFMQDAPLDAAYRRLCEAVE